MNEQVVSPNDPDEPGRQNDQPQESGPAAASVPSDCSGIRRASALLLEAADILRDDAVFVINEIRDTTLMEFGVDLRVSRRTDPSSNQSEGIAS